MPCHAMPHMLSACHAVPGPICRPKHPPYNRALMCARTLVCAGIDSYQCALITRTVGLASSCERRRCHSLCAAGNRLGSAGCGKAKARHAPAPACLGPPARTHHVCRFGPVRFVPNRQRTVEHRSTLYAASCGADLRGATRQQVDHRARPAMCAAAPGPPTTCHICTGNGLAAATSAPGPGAPLPTSAPGLGLAAAHICTGTGARPAMP